MIPTLTTERLTLRPYERSDWNGYRAFTETERTKFMGGPIDSEKAWGWFTNDIASWALYGFGTLAIDLEGTMVGFAGIVHPPSFPEAENGWALFEGYEGQGYATEAAAAMLDFAFSSTDLTTVVSYVDKNNFASQAVAKRLGGTLDPNAPTPWEDGTDHVYRYSKGAVQ